MNKKTVLTRSRSTFSWKQQFISSYRGWKNWLGITLASLAILSWLIRTFSISIGEILTQVRAGYEAVFYPALDFALSWVPIDFSPLMKDFTLIYLVAAGAVGRTAFVWIDGYKKADVMSVSAGRVELFAKFLVDRPFLKWLNATFMGFFWPIGILPFLAQPVLMQHADFAMLWDWKNIRKALKLDQDMDFNDWLLLDLRVVLFLQVAAVGVIVSLLILINMSGF